MNKKKTKTLQQKFFKIKKKNSPTKKVLVRNVLERIRLWTLLDFFRSAFNALMTNPRLQRMDSDLEPLHSEDMDTGEVNGQHAAQGNKKFLALDRVTRDGPQPSPTFTYRERAEDKKASALVIFFSLHVA
jgi:hypothetical protein